MIPHDPYGGITFALFEVIRFITRILKADSESRAESRVERNFNRKLIVAWIVESVSESNGNAASATIYANSRLPLPSGTTTQWKKSYTKK